MAEKFGRRTKVEGAFQVRRRLSEGYLRYRIVFVKRFDANSYLYNKAMILLF
jgi:homoserine acetyltransferase